MVESKCLIVIVAVISYRRLKLLHLAAKQIKQYTYMEKLRYIR